MTLQIYTSPSCGWALRNYAALLYKGEAFELVQAFGEEGSKTAQFEKSTPLAKTPVLTCGSFSIWESLLINEFIEDQFPDPALMPKRPMDCAEGRAWMHFCDTVLIPAVGPILKGKASASDALGANLDLMLKARVWPQNGYFFDAGLSLVDLAFYTLFNLLDLLDQEGHGNFYEGRPVLQSWADGVKSESCLVRAAQLPDQLVAVNSLRIEANSVGLKTRTTLEG